MSRPATTWLITDTHWYHDLMIELCGRPPDFMELTLKWWRYYVQPQDEVIHLGDVILYKDNLLKDILDSLPGTKTLVMGNHDRKSRSWYMRNGFQYAADMLVIKHVLYSHRPLDTAPADIKHIIHGHLHGTGHHAPGADPRNRLLALENTEYKPVRQVDFLNAVKVSV